MIARFELTPNTGSAKQARTAAATGFFGHGMPVHLHFLVG